MIPDHTQLHRTAKYFMDDGRAATAGDAIAMLSRFGLTVAVDPAIARTVNGQIALLTLVNAARRTLLGGIEIVGDIDCPVLTRLATEGSLRDAVTALGGRSAQTARPDWPVAILGDEAVEAGSAPAWRLSWSGWRGGVVPASWTLPAVSEAIPLAPAMAAAACVGEVFAWYAGDHPMAGYRASGLSIWRPSHDWLMADADEPGLHFLPSALWLIGLGNLGQAFAWLLAALPFASGTATLTLQDFDRMVPSNDSTSLLAEPEQPEVLKTRWMAAWLEKRGFETRIVESPFGPWTGRTTSEPAVALCGVDNAQARAALEDAGFDLVVEAGLGAGTQSFRNFSLHCFPGSKQAAEIWGGNSAASIPDVSDMPAYRDLKTRGVDRCGLTQLASRTIGVPFVGLTAGILVIGELLRRIHGAPATELVSGSLNALEDVEAFTGTFEPYGYGHVGVAGAQIQDMAD